MERDKGNPFHQPPVPLHPSQDHSPVAAPPEDAAADERAAFDAHHDADGLDATAPWATSGPFDDLDGFDDLDDFDGRHGLDERSEQLLALLWDLDGVTQDPRYHPEGDALYHSLQVYQHALASTDDPALLAAALLHDVGKAEGSQGHAARGAAWLEAIGVPASVCWLVAHHMDLLHSPTRTRRRLGASQPARLAQLEALRRWDQLGRDPHARVMSPEEAIEALPLGPDGS